MVDCLRSELTRRVADAALLIVAQAHIDETVATFTSSGGKIALPKMAVPGVGWLAYGMDPEGNMIGMMQMDANAK